LDLVEEKRDMAMVRLASYQQRIKREYNRNVKPRVFRTGDLVSERSWPTQGSRMKGNSDRIGKGPIKCRPEQDRGPIG
jgi:hypothetical protein